MDEMREYAYADRWGNEYVLAFSRAKYFENGNLAVLAYNKGDYGWEPYATVTVNIEPLGNPYAAAIDTNNLGEDIVGWLSENGIAQPTGDVLPSGFCAFPVVEFDHEWIDSLIDESAE